jgi:hypothetical protein
MKNSRTVLALAAIVAAILLAPCTISKASAAVRPPSVPLVACDPYFSVWSASDELAGSTTRHWTGHEQPMTSMVMVDGQAFRLMGEKPEVVNSMSQKSLEVLPTKTTYTFEGAGVAVNVVFQTPLLPDDLELMSRPASYINWSAKSIDGKDHAVKVYFDASMDLAVNDRDQKVEWSKEKIAGQDVLKAGTVSQNILARKGDNVRIDWGYIYVAAGKDQKPVTAITKAQRARLSFVRRGKMTAAVDTDMPLAVADNAPVMAMQFDLGKVGKSAQGCQVVLAYDDIYSVLYFGQQLKGYWKKDGQTAEQMIEEAVNDYDSIAKRCEKFDTELMADLLTSGGEDYQTIGALAYRQALAANKIVADKKGMPLMFSKENFSNGCMGTVDVFYPFAPQVLLLNTTLAKATVVPILEYGRSERWRFPFAPHDIGTYPQALGQVYGGGERSEDNQMPVEESGNMILLMSAIVQAENDVEFARQYWDILTVWAEYLKSKGLDPENQLCTDDFAGHLAHNVNLSVKAIVALGGYAKLADMMGEKDVAASYRKTAEEYVSRWLEMADDGDHYRLAFDREGTWSQKYNLVWDRLLDLNLFPESVAKKEMAYYKKMQKTYGLPLDNRSDYTKLDWIVWTASITGDKDDFKALTAPIVKFLNTTPDRVPMTDWYWTQNARHRGFQARPVVGGVFIRMMDDKKMWEKWVENGESVEGTWAPIPKAPKVVTVVPTARDAQIIWSYTTDKPANDWMKANFDDSSWKKGKAGFGSKGTPGAELGTEWTSSDIWIRRTFEFKSDSNEFLKFYAHHDEDAEVYVNGVKVIELLGFTGNYQAFELSERFKKALKDGENTIAIHCHQETGGQYIDAGFSLVIPQE